MTTSGEIASNHRTVKNTVFGRGASQYDYANDALGRRTAISRSGMMMSEKGVDYDRS